MFQAIGRSAARNPDNTFNVKVELMDDRTGTSVGFRTYSNVASKAALQAAVLTDLQALRAAETDAALNAAIVGQLLGQI
jgi:hypothetical protein